MAQKRWRPQIEPGRKKLTARRPASRTRSGGQRSHRRKGGGLAGSGRPGALSVLPALQDSPLGMSTGEEAFGPCVYGGGEFSELPWKYDKCMTKLLGN